MTFSFSETSEMESAPITISHCNGRYKMYSDVDDNAVTMRCRFSFT